MESDIEQHLNAGHDLLKVEQLEVHIETRLLLQNIDLTFAQTGFYVIMGPVGVGKSTLMSVFSGLRVDDVVKISFDSALFADQPLSNDNHPYVIKQATRSEQARRTVSSASIRKQINAALLSEPKMLCLDEPCATVAHDEAMPILQHLKDESKHRAIVMVTHNSEHARLFADWVVLLGGGRVVEQNTTEQIFNTPKSKVTKQFLRTGSMAIPRPDANARSLAPEFRGVPDLGDDADEDATLGPICWIIRKSFAVAQDSILKQKPADIVAELKAQDISVVILCDNQGLKLRAPLEASGIRVILDLHKSQNSHEDIQKHLALATHIQTEMSQGHKVTTICDKPERSKILAAIQLVQMGITVGDAVTLLNGKIQGPQISVSDEQFLWNLELELDMDSTLEPASPQLSAATQLI